MEQTGIRLSAEAFGPLYPYIVNPEITDVDYNGTDLWIVTTDNRRRKIDTAKESISTSFLEQFCGRVANEVSRSFNQMENVLEDLFRYGNLFRQSVFHRMKRWRQNIVQRKC